MELRAGALPDRTEGRASGQAEDRPERLQQVPDRDREKLADRLSRLEAGHPSSRLDEDGTPRPPAPRLSDYETPKPPLNDADYAAHRDKVVAFLKESHEATHENTTINPDKNIWSDERIVLQDEILREAYDSAAEVPCERKAIIAGGLGGAGKTTVLERVAGVDTSKYLTINPDECKEALARHHMLPDVPGLSPMEVSGLGHEESSYIAKRLAMRAYAEGKNVIWDITMSRPESVISRISELRAAGYEQVDGVFIDIPVETSVARSEARHRRGHDLYLAGNGPGGRYVPPEVIRAQADPEHGTINRKAFESAKPHFDNWVIFDNSVDGRPAVVVERSDPDPKRPEAQI
jgi:predicted kinase